MYDVVLLPEAKKFYKKLFLSNKSHFQRVAQALESLSLDVLQGKVLKHKLKGKYSLRVGVYRIIYSVEKKEVAVYVFDIGHRKNIYR